ncbi:DUF397 domain-containing protein [Spirillospora sp. NPDC052269]
MRDSKDVGGSALAFSVEQARGFVARIKDGELGL